MRSGEEAHYRPRLHQICWAVDEWCFVPCADVIRRRAGGVDPSSPAPFFGCQWNFEGQRLPISVDHDVKHSARRVACRQGETVGIVTPIRLIEFDAMNLNVSLTEKISQRLIAPTTLDKVVKAMTDE